MADQSAPCVTCGALIFTNGQGKWFNAGDRQAHTCPPKAAKPAAKEAEARLVCSECKMPSRSAMIVKDLGGGRGRCVNTAACEKRQRKLPVKP